MRSSRALPLVLLFSSVAFVVLPGCGANDGGACQENADCASGLICCGASSSIRGVCRPVGTTTCAATPDAGGTDAGPVDAPTVDAPAEDAPSDDAGEPTDAPVEADGGVDAGVDPGDDAGIDAGGTDAGTDDAGADDAGADAP